MINIKLPVIDIHTIENGWFNAGKNIHIKKKQAVSEMTSPYKVPLGATTQAPPAVNPLK